MKKKTKKLVGNDVYVCIGNENYEQELIISKPYRVEKMCRDEINEIWVLIKNEQREQWWYPLKLFRSKR